MEKNIQLLNYADASELLIFVDKIKADSKNYFKNYQVDLLKLDDIYLHKLLFDYKILAFKEDNKSEFVVFKVPELEETECGITLWLLKLDEYELFEAAINKIKTEYSFYDWKYIKISLLRRQLTDKLKEFIEKYTKEQPIILHGNFEENDRFLYRINL